MIITEIWFSEDQIFGRDENGRVYSQSLRWYPRLKAATADEREQYSFGFDGIYWRNIDEDISFESFTYDDADPTLAGSPEEPEQSLVTVVEDKENCFLKDNIPTGDSVEDRRCRQKIILTFYQEWKRHNPDAKRYNLSLKDDINIRFVSIKETSGHASLTYLSTLAVLQLDAILTNAVLIDKSPSNPKKNNQNGFESMLRMIYNCPGIGTVRMLVGVKRSDKSKVQYCITAIDVERKKQEAQ